MIRDVHMYFNKLDRIAHFFINEHLKETGLSRGLFFYILELSHHDGISLQELSKAVFVDKANTTRAVNKLLNLGYATRTANEEDQRAYKIFLTDSGKEIARLIQSIFLKWRDLISEGLTEEEKVSVLEISHKLYENALNYYDQSENGGTGNVGC